MRTTMAPLTPILLFSLVVNAGPLTVEARPANAADETAKTAPVSPDELLQRGENNYRSGHYTEAISDLRGASDAFLTPEQMRAYVNSGKFASLPKFETAVIYLAMSYAKLGRDAEASEQIHRLNVAEAIEPIYAKLPLTADVADFEKVVARVAPKANLPANAALAQLRNTTTATTQVAQATPAPATTQTATATPAPAPKPSVQPAIPEDRAAQQRIIEERVAAERTAAERDAAEKIAAAQQAAQRSIEQRVAEERAAIEKAAQEKIAAGQAAAQKAADEKVAAERAAAQKAADERIAAETAAAQQRANQQAEQQIAEARAAIEKKTQEQIAAARVAAEQEAANRVRAAAEEARRNEETLIRQADSAANGGNVDQANAMYSQLASSANASRDAIAAAGTGLYRTGDFADAVKAFQRLQNFGRGEEDLRYYNAVSLYETGRYEAARKELKCALPYIQITDDVSRYRAKIEHTANQQAMK